MPAPLRAVASLFFSAEGVQRTAKCAGRTHTPFTDDASNDDSADTVFRTCMEEYEIEIQRSVREYCDFS